MAGNDSRNPFLSLKGYGEGTNMGKGVDYIPTPRDVHAVRLFMHDEGGLPFEIIDNIIDDAEYWTCSRSEVDYSLEAGGTMETREGGGSKNRLVVSQILSLNKILSTFFLC
jgi:hypothetical protein